MLSDHIRRDGLMNVDLIGPAPAFFSKLGGRSRYHILLRGEDGLGLLSQLPLPVGWRADVDPISLL